MNPNQQWSQYQQPQQTGFQQPLYAQQTGFPQQQQQQQQPSFPRPPLPQGASGQYSFLNAPPPPSVNLTPQQTGWQPPIRTQATGWGNSAGTPGLVPQQTGWQGGGGQAPLMPQATGWHDPRLTMMSSSFMPMNSSAVRLPFSRRCAWVDVLEEQLFSNLSRDEMRCDVLADDCVSCFPFLSTALRTGWRSHLPAAFAPGR